MQSSNILKTSTSAGLNLGKWIWKNKYILIIIFSLLPTLLVAWNYSKETKNYYYIPLAGGLSVINSDGVLGEYVYYLENEPSKVLGMEKPEKNIFLKMKYVWNEIVLVWAIVGLVSMIFLPFVFFKWFYTQFNDSTRVKARVLGAVTFILFITFVNLITMFVNMASGNIVYTLDKSLDFFGQAKQVIGMVLPLHGMFALIKFLVGQG